MALEAIARLEELVERLLAERVKLQVSHQELTAECDRLYQDRLRVCNELDKLLGKLENLEGKKQ